MCDVSGYGTSGPCAGRRAYDLLVQCETGVLSVTGTPQEPAKVGISVADISAGMYAYSSILGVQNEREWRRLCIQVLDRPALAADARFASNDVRVRHRDDLTAAIQAAFATLDTSEVLRRLDGAQIANGAYNTVTDLLQHPQLDWTSIDTPSGPVRALRPPVRIAGVEPVLGAVPDVGEHTSALPREFGYGEAEIAAWRQRGAV